MPVSKRSEAVATLLLVAAMLGIVYGLIEALEVSALRLIPGALSWRNGNSAHVLWFAPLFYAVTFGFIALLLIPFTLLTGRIRWHVVVAFVAFALGAFLALTLPGRPFSDLAAAILALGLAAELTRQFGRRDEQLLQLARRAFPFVIIAVLLIAGVTIAAGAMRERLAMRQLPAASNGHPNVLLLIIDTQRADHLSVYGYARQSSPQLEQFAREATVFENAYATSSWTLPTHASIMTGKHLHEHRAGVMRQPYLDDRFPTLAEELKRHGYATGGFVANTFWAGRQTGLSRGFIRYEDFYGNLGDAVARTALGRRLAYDVLPRYGLQDVPGRKYAAEINRDLLKWVDRVGPRPFFAFVNYFDVHGPYLPPAPFAGTFAKGPDVREKKIDIGALTNDVVVPAPDKLQHMVDRYDESILFLDAELKRLADALRERGILDRTIVIITSDHGESWGEHGMMYHGHSLYREQLHVPLIVRFPERVTRDARVNDAVTVQQIPATVAELTGLRLSAFPQPSLFSRDSMRAPVAAELAQRSTVAANWPSSRGWLSSLLTDNWQFTLYKSGAAELFQLPADPQQLRNLARHPETADTVRELRARLNAVSPEGGLEWRK